MSELKLMMNQKVTRVVMILILLLVGLTLTGYYILLMQLDPVDPGDNTCIDIRIAENNTASQVAELLYSNRLIRNETLFLAYCRHKGLDSSLKAGHYQFNRSQSLREIAADISVGKVVTIAFTIPEGYTVDKIGELLVEKDICTIEEWQQAINTDYNYEFLQLADPGEGKSYLEGFLFPDTYVIAEDTSAAEIVNAMLGNFEKLWAEEFEQQALDHGMNVYDTIIIASMIEKEAMADDERKTISGVIKNRLEKGMLLQIDATVLYILNNDEKDIIYYEDLEIDSPYNTYLYSGLPQAPIACPGKAAIDAALNPEQHEYLYYVARGDGSHQFSKTYSEHLQAKACYIE